MLTEISTLKLKSYYEKKSLMETLADELQKLEDDQAFKSEMEFKNKIEDLLTQYEKTPVEAVDVLTILDPDLAQKLAPKKSISKSNDWIGPKRPLVTYKNPHSGEVVKTRGGNHKRLNEWRTKYGKEAVDSWKN